MNTQTEENEIRRLVEDYENLSLSDSETDRLILLLESDREARTIYREHMKTSAFLRQEARTRNLLSPVSPSTTRIRRIPRRFVYIPIMAAVACVAVSATVFFLIAAKDPKATFRASYGASFHHYSKDGDQVTRDIFQKGETMELLEGSMEVQMPDDVVAILTAPSFVRFEDEGLLYLDRGSAWIEVGRRGRGFRVRTPGVEATDLGTEFGVIVPPPGSEGSEEIHVGKGEVNVVSKTVPDETELLKTSQSVRLMPDGHLARIPSRTAALRKSFDSGILAQYTFNDTDVFGRGTPSMGIHGKGGSYSISSPLMFGPGFSSPATYSPLLKSDGLLFLDISNKPAGNIGEDTLVSALRQQDYFEFTVTSRVAEFDVSELTFDFCSTGADRGVDGLHLFTSVDGFTSPENAVASLTAPENFRFAAASFSPQRIVLEKDKFRNLSRITFRIYVEDGGGQSFSAGANFDNILVLGTVSPTEE